MCVSKSVRHHTCFPTLAQSDSPASCCSFKVFNDGDLPPVSAVWAEAIQIQAAVPGQGACDWTQGDGHVGGGVPVLVQVRRQRPLARGHFLADGRVDGQLRGQLALDGRGALELVVDVDAEPSPGLLELCRHVCRPLGGMSSKFTDLQREREISKIVAFRPSSTTCCSLYSNNIYMCRYYRVVQPQKIM